MICIRSRIEDRTPVELVEAYPYVFEAAYGPKNDTWALSCLGKIEQNLKDKFAEKEVEWILNWALNEYSEGREAKWTDEVTEQMWKALY